jgi:hypothetical protein
MNAHDIDLDMSKSQREAPPSGKKKGKTAQEKSHAANKTLSGGACGVRGVGLRVSLLPDTMTLRVHRFQVKKYLRRWPLCWRWARR